MGRRVRRVVRRTVRRIWRETERAVRRSWRESERVWRDVGDVVGAVPVVGDVIGATGLVETPLMKEQERLEEQEKRRQEELERQRREQEAEEAWAKEQAKYSQNIMGTQQGLSSAYNSSTDLANVLTGSDDETDDDILKKFLKKK